MPLWHKRGRDQTKQPKCVRIFDSHRSWHWTELCDHIFMRASNDISWHTIYRFAAWFLALARQQSCKLFLGIESMKVYLGMGTDSYLIGIFIEFFSLLLHACSNTGPNFWRLSLVPLLPIRAIQVSCKLSFSVTKLKLCTQRMNLILTQE